MYPFESCTESRSYESDFVRIEGWGATSAYSVIRDAEAVVMNPDARLSAWTPRFNRSLRAVAETWRELVTTLIADGWQSDRNSYPISGFWRMCSTVTTAFEIINADVARLGTVADIQRYATRSYRRVTNWFSLPIDVPTPAVLMERAIQLVGDNGLSLQELSQLFSIVDDYFLKEALDDVRRLDDIVVVKEKRTGLNGRHYLQLVYRHLAPKRD